MGRTLHEVFRIREVRDHRTGGTVVALNPPDTGSNRDPEIDVLRLVQPIPGGWDRSSGGWQASLRGSGLNQVKVLHRPRLLSDNGPSYVSSELGKWLEDNGIRHIRGRPYHPMTQGKIERYHRSMKNRILLDNYYLPGQLEQSIQEFVSYYNNCRYHESLDNLTPA